MQTAACVVNVFNPDILSVLTQGGAADYPVTEETVSVRDDGVTVYEDVTYASDYPNNTYTVYVTPGAKGMVFYIHGGGLVKEDKMEREAYLSEIVKAGFNVVTVDYCLAPQSPYPASTLQVNEALKFFVDEAQL